VPGLALGAAAIVLAPGNAHAQSVRTLRYDTGLDVGVTAGAGALWIGSELLKAQLAPSTCRWCDPPGIDEGVRDALKWSTGSGTSTADTISNVLGFGLVPLSVVGLNALAASHDDAIKGAPVDALVVVEATVVAMGLNQLTKFIVGRERPFVHALAPDQKQTLPSQPSDNNVSFFSGHTTETFSLAVAAGTVAQMRGYRFAPLVWAVGGVLAFTTAYMRIAADKHYFTDVTVGMIVGSAIGFAVPYFFHSPAASDTGAAASPLTVGPLIASPGGVSIGGVW
jgi:membrane-associated phospholipid phosphatase